MKEPTWIRMVKLKTDGIPAHAHPDDESVPVNLSGGFMVKWPNGSITLRVPAKTVHVSTKLRNGTEVHGPYTYFEGQVHGMDVIYELHEVELCADEVAKNLATTKRKAA